MRHLTRLLLLAVLLSPGAARALALTPGSFELEGCCGLAVRVHARLEAIPPVDPEDPFAFPGDLVPTGSGSDVLAGWGPEVAIFQVENIGTETIHEFGVTALAAGGGIKYPSWVGYVEGGPEPDGLADVFMLGGMIGLIPVPFPVLFTDPADPSSPGDGLAPGETSQEFFVMSRSEFPYAEGDAFTIRAGGYDAVGTFQVVPEPATVLLMAWVGGLALGSGCVWRRAADR